MCLRAQRVLTYARTIRLCVYSYTECPYTRDRGYFHDNVTILRSAS